MPKGVKAKTAVLVNKQVLVVLSYLYSDLLPPNMQLNLEQVLASVKDEFAESPIEQRRAKRKRAKSDASEPVQPTRAVPVGSGTEKHLTRA